MPGNESSSPETHFFERTRRLRTQKKSKRQKHYWCDSNPSFKRPTNVQEEYNIEGVPKTLWSLKILEYYAGGYNWGNPEP